MSDDYMLLADEPDDLVSVELIKPVPHDVPAGPLWITVWPHCSGRYVVDWHTDYEAALRWTMTDDGEPDGSLIICVGNKA